MLIFTKTLLLYKLLTLSVYLEGFCNTGSLWRVDCIAPMGNLSFLSKEQHMLSNKLTKKLPAICPPLQDREISLSAFSNRSTSGLADFSQSLHVECHAGKLRILILKLSLV